MNALVREMYAKRYIASVPVIREVFRGTIFRPREKFFGVINNLSLTAQTKLLHSTIQAAPRAPKAVHIDVFGMDRYWIGSFGFHTRWVHVWDDVIPSGYFCKSLGAYIPQSEEA